MFFVVVIFKNFSIISSIFINLKTNLNMKSKLLTFTLFLLTTFGFSQSYEVSGKVVDESSNTTMPGVNIIVKNSNQSLSTDIDGKFKISNLSSESVLVFSFIGFKSYELKVSKSQNLTVKLASDSKSLEEVVVIGYGTQKKKDLTGAVGLVNTKTIDQLKPIKFEQALQGTVSGVFVTAQSGAPGAGLDIRIRGIQSNADNRPLYIVDGNISDPSILNPSDIESLTVLKDAQAAIYGVQAANGVVIIKTKSGKRNSKTQFSYNSYTGLQETTKKLNLLNATEYALLLNESYANGGQPIPYPNVSNLGNGTDWQKEIFNLAPIYSHDINISAGSEKINYAVSGSHLFQDAIVGGSKSDFKRSTAALSLNADLSSKLKLQTSVNYSFINRVSLNENGLGSVLFNAVNTPSTIKPYDSNGIFSLVPSTPGFGIEVINPLAQIDNTYNDYNIKRISGYLGLDYQLTKDLVFSSKIGFNTSNSEFKKFNKIVNYGGKVFDVARSSVEQNGINDNSYNLDLYFTYKKVIAEKHNFGATLGTSNTKEFGNGLFATGFDVPNNSWDFADIGLALGISPARAVGSYAYDERLNSYFLRLQYDYDGKYLISGILRRDSSTKFGPDFAVAYFPSMTAGWVVSEENFLKNSESINFMKFRGSYGILGNNKIPANGYVGFLNGEGTYVFNNQLQFGTALGLIANPKLKWEEARKFDVGLDLKLFKNAIDITTDYFIESRYNLLVAGLPVSGIVGANGPGGQPPIVNAGNIRNKGYEFAIGYNKKIGNKFSYNINYNITTIKNEVLQVGNNNIIQGGSFSIGQQPITRFQVGESIGYFYGLQTDGIFQNQAEVNAHPSQAGLGSVASPGDIRFKDSNGDGVINFDDRTNVGSPLPDFTMGFNFNIKYGNLDFAAYSYASIGNDMVRNYERSLSDLNKLNYVLGRWTGEGTSNYVPRVTTSATTNNLFSDYFVEDASFFRIQNVQLGYTINRSFTDKVGISKLRLYSSVNNVYTFTKYRGFDPTASNGAAIGNGIDNGFYPTSRVFILGVNLNF